MRAGDAYFREIGEVPYWCNANTGDGVVAILDVCPSLVRRWMFFFVIRPMPPKPAAFFRRPIMIMFMLYVARKK